MRLGIFPFTRAWFRFVRRLFSRSVHSLSKSKLNWLFLICRSLLFNRWLCQYGWSWWWFDLFTLRRRPCLFVFVGDLLKLILYLILVFLLSDGVIKHFLDDLTNLFRLHSKALRFFLKFVNCSYHYLISGMACKWFWRWFELLMGTYARSTKP